MNSKANTKKKAEVTRLPVKQHPKLKRLVKRGVRLFEPNEDVLKYYYAGYRLGAFSEQIPDETLSVEEFNLEFEKILAKFSHYFSAMRDDGKPLCLGLANLKDGVLDIHSIWMPWASARNKIETTVAFYREYNRWYTVISTFPERVLPFYQHIRKYGVVRIVGHFNNFGDNGTVYIVQGVDF